MVRTVKLLDYLPQFMREYREMQYVMSAQQPEIQILCDSTETIKDDQFISSSSENGIKKFENMLGIIPESGESLQDRKAYVLAKWLDTIPYTMRVLERRLDALLGAQNYTLNHDSGNYTVSISTPLSNSSLSGALDELLDSLIPANILWDTLFLCGCDIAVKTELSVYVNDSPRCGKLVCGGRWRECH